MNLSKHSHCLFLQLFCLSIYRTSYNSQSKENANHICSVSNHFFPLTVQLFGVTNWPCIYLRSHCIFSHRNSVKYESIFSHFIFTLLRMRIDEGGGPLFFFFFFFFGMLKTCFCFIVFLYKSAGCVSTIRT